jgi:uracil-DNA glycosylase
MPPDQRMQLPERADRRRELYEPHIAPLTRFVESLRVRVGPEAAIPYFDPWDGGVRAEVLYLLEAPGAKAVASGFISRNNPDETARNFFEMNAEAGIPRDRTVTWNIVPWYIGSATRIRAANRTDISLGIECLTELLPLLPELRAVVLLGHKAEAAAEPIARLRPDLRLFRSPHPSPLYVNNKPGNRDRILMVLRDVAAFLRGHDAAV